MRMLRTRVLAMAATLVSALALVAVIAAADFATATRASMPRCSPAWQGMPMKSPKNSWLNGIAAISKTDVWVVGAQKITTDRTRPLIEHWDGRTWRSFRGALEFGQLMEVAGTAADDVWAVGYDDSGARVAPIVEHWNGREWASFEPPSPLLFEGAPTGVLWDVAAVSRRSVWVVERGQNEVAVVHWDGARWSTVGPNRGGNAIAATADDDVWVGGSGGSASHWNRERWIDYNLNPLVRPLGESGVYLRDVATSPTGVWAVGDVEKLEGHETSGVILRWNGTRWRLAFRRSNMIIIAVAASGARDAWAIAYSPALPYREEYGPPLLLHWDGTRWRPLLRPKIFAGADLNALATFSAVDVWAVGSSRTSKAIALRYACTR